MSFSTSLSGLSANQQKLDVIGNNLANINTVAFKASTVEFSDLVSQSIGGPSANPMQIGLGVTVGAITPNFAQGGIENTGIATNVAIQGSGFFMVGATGSTSYTRAGDFSFRPDGTLVSSEGLPVQGFTARDPVTNKLDTTAQPTNVVVPPGVLQPPTETTVYSTQTNLNANASVGDTFSTAIQIYDALGKPHVLTAKYTNTGSGQWSYDVTVPGEDVTGGTTGTPQSVLSAPGTLLFDGTGALTKVDGQDPSVVNITTPIWSNGAAASKMTWDMVGADGKAALTSYSSASANSSITQNGAPAGVVNVLSINSNGEIVATLGAGQTVVVAQLALATFNNPVGLVKVGGNRFDSAAGAGEPNIGVAGTGGRGSLIGSSLEQSNVNMAQEFTQMILAQRGYQANSKSITTADELLQETLSLKR